MLGFLWLPTHTNFHLGNRFYTCLLSLIGIIVQLTSHLFAFYMRTLPLGALTFYLRVQHCESSKQLTLIHRILSLKVSGYILLIKVHEALLSLNQWELSYVIV